MEGGRFEESFRFLLERSMGCFQVRCGSDDLWYDFKAQITMIFNDFEPWDWKQQPKNCLCVGKSVGFYIAQGPWVL